MPVTFIPLDQFMPAGSAFGEGLAEAKNVIPAFGSMYPLRAPTAGQTVTGTEGPITGAYAHLFPSGGGSTSYLGDAITLFSGTRRRLYNAATGADLSRGGLYAVVATDEPAGWRFASFGNDIWACNGFDIFQRRTNNAGAFANGPASTFVPRPRYCVVVRDFMVVADLSANGGGFTADQFTWSDANDATWYDDRTGTRATSLSGGPNGKRIRSRPGQITGLVGGEYGLLFKRNSIHGLQLVGGADVWRLDEVDRSVGCVLPGSLIVGRQFNYFFGGSGFYRQSGLSPAEKISPAWIDEMIVDTYYQTDRSIIANPVSTMADEDLTCVGFMSFRTGAIGWLYTSATHSPSQKFALIFHDPQSGSWTYADDNTHTGGFSYILGLPFNYDTAASKDLLRCVAFTWTGTDNIHEIFTGDTLAATLKTKRRAMSLTQEGAPQTVAIKGVAPFVTAPKTLGTSDPIALPALNVTIKVTLSNNQFFSPQLDADGTTISPRSETISVGANANDWGWLPYSGQGRLFDIEMTLPAALDWTRVDGVWVHWEPLG